MFDWLDDIDWSGIVDSVADTAGSTIGAVGDGLSSVGDFVGDFVGDGLGYIGDGLSSMGDYVGDGLSWLTDSLGGTQSAEGLGLSNLAYPSVSDISNGPLMNVSAPPWVTDTVTSQADPLGDFISNLQDVPQVANAGPSTLSEALSASTKAPSMSLWTDMQAPQAPSTIFDISNGLNENPVATELAWKRMLEDPNLMIAPKDYALSSPTILDKLLSQNGASLSGSSSFGGGFEGMPTETSYADLPGQQTPVDPYANWPTETSDADLATKAGDQKQANWLQALLERPEVGKLAGTGLSIYGKSALGKILGTGLAGAQIARALHSKTGTGQAPKMQQAQIAAKPMTWGKPKNKAVGGPINGSVGGLRQACECGLLKGQSAGQDDAVPINASHGEYVFDADTVSALGDGNTEAGAKKLDEMRKNIRRHKRSAPPTKIPPKAKKVTAYLKGAA